MTAAMSAAADTSDTARAASCDGKEPFTSWAIARTAAGRRKGRTVYRCRFCRLFHVAGPDAAARREGD